MLDLKDIQKELIVLLTEIDEICRKHDIPYYLSGGTLLGALRHEGFIPWDDDLDVNMPREDWPRFRESFRARFGGKYVIFEPGTPPGYLRYARRRMTH